MTILHDAAFDGAVRLSHWGLIRAQGADAASFLHGQLTNDVAHLAPGQARLAGYCSAKGRLLASFIIWRDGPEDVLLACDASVVAATVKRLSMFVLRAKCKLSDATAERPLWGLMGPAAAAAAEALAPWQMRASTEPPPTGGACATLLRLPAALCQPRAVWIGVGPGDAPPQRAESPVSLDAWRALEVHSALPIIEAATADRFVPQMLNYELIGGVNFQKGCYPGQEVVARSQYRGTAKRRMFLFHSASPAAAGDEVFHSGDPGQPAGMVVNSAPRSGGPGQVLLVEVKLAARESGDLRLGSAQGPVLAELPMPYEVPVEAPADAT